ncbi:uncharacterized protein LOC144438225 isoform X2 [Glandiceps talaboti]
MRYYWILLAIVMSTYWGNGETDVVYSGCSGTDRIVVTDGNGNEVASLCSNADKGSYETKTGQFKLTFTTDSNSGTNNGFQAVFNQYYEKDSSCNSDSSDFHCDNDWCIPESLRCDGTKHCSDNTDEVGCSGDTSTTTIIIIVSVVIVVIIFGVVIIGLVIKKVCANSKRKATKSRVGTGIPADEGVTVSATPAHMQRPVGELGATYDPAYPAHYDPTYPTMGVDDMPPGLHPKYNANLQTS